MCTLYENILSLCKERGITGGRMCTELGLSKSLMTDLKSGRKKSIHAETAKKIAEYFGVSVDRVLGKETEKAPTPEDERNDELSEYLEMLRNRPECRMLFSLAKGATKEDVETAVTIIEAIRKKEGR